MRALFPKHVAMVALAALVLASPALAAPAGGAASTITAADTVWMLLSAALVMLMTPGLAFFYGGLVRKKNVLSILMQCFMALCVVSVQWVVMGYSLSFGPDWHGLIGNLDWLGLRGVGMEPCPYAPKVPHTAFVIFQMMFAAITPGLVIGAFAERMRFSAYCLFCILWSTLVYDPIAHWVWGQGGFLGVMGAKDFAGGIVVHINAGMAALAAALYLGRRRGFPNSISPPHSLPVATLGAALLWFGWFGFNAGSALEANGVAVQAFLNTHIAGAVAGLVWCVLDWMKYRRPTTLGMITGVVAGLAAVTPGAGYVDLGGAMAIGALSGLICWGSVTLLKVRLGYDDSLDAFGVHGVGGIWGTLAVGIWAVSSVNGACGVVEGHWELLAAQFKAVGVCMTYSFVVSLGLFFAVDKVCQLRVSEHEERVGLDLTQHREAGYTVID